MEGSTAGRVANEIDATAIILGDVRMGSGNIIGPQTILQGPITMGDDNWMVACSIGLPPEHRTWWMDQVTPPVGVAIGDRTVIREYVTIHSGLEQPTEIGSDCYLMTKSHVGHDAVLGAGVTVSCSTLIGGHCTIDAGANLGLASVIHQRLRVGAGAMLGMNATVTRDVPAFATAFGSPARVRGVNRPYLERMGWSPEEIDAVAETLAVWSDRD